jgi:hypothetical protein
MSTRGDAANASKANFFRAVLKMPWAKESCLETVGSEDAALWRGFREMLASHRCESAFRYQLA